MSFGKLCCKTKLNKFNLLGTNKSIMPTNINLLFSILKFCRLSFLYKWGIMVAWKNNDGALERTKPKGLKEI
jgi:hypothetical protein